MSNNSVSANAVIIKEDSILLQQRSDVPIWVLPGGHQEPNESLQQTAIREVKEETGFDVKALHRVGTYQTSYLKYHDLTDVFLCEIKGGVESPNNEVLQLKWFELQDLPTTLLYLHKERIHDALEGKKDVQVIQRVKLLKVLMNLQLNPILLGKLLLFSAKKIT